MAEFMFWFSSVELEHKVWFKKALFFQMWSINDDNAEIASIEQFKSGALTYALIYCSSSQFSY